VRVAPAFGQAELFEAGDHAGHVLFGDEHLPRHGGQRHRPAGGGENGEHGPLLGGDVAPFENRGELSRQKIRELNDSGDEIAIRHGRQCIDD
jgi:hypothetical protein